MWRIAYNVGVHAILPLFAILSLFRKKLRVNFIERLRPVPSRQELRGGIWIHAASIGEAAIAESLITRMGQSKPGSFVVTANTHYTRDLLRRKFGNSVEVASAPFDLPFSINRFIGKRRFDALLIIETEMWPNTIWMAKRKGIPVIIVNGRISDSTLGRYRSLSSFLKVVLKSVDLVLAQSREHAERFISVGVDAARVVTTGNLKYYREIPAIQDHQTRGRVVTFGSVKEKELPAIMSVMFRLKQEIPDTRFFLAPRELRLIDTIEHGLPSGLTSCRYSQLKQDVSSAKADVVIVDTVGDLVGIYGESAVAFVGGSLAPYGGQNVLEPLFVKTPVVFGPYMENFKAIAEEIVARKAGTQVRDEDELLSAIRTALEDPEKRRNLVDAGQEILAFQQGTMTKTVDLILETIWKNSAGSCN